MTRLLLSLLSVVGAAVLTVVSGVPLSLEYFDNSSWAFHTLGFKPWHMDFTKVNHVIYGYFTITEDCKIVTAADDPNVDFLIEYKNMGMDDSNWTGDKGAVGAFQLLQQWASAEELALGFKLIAAIGGPENKTNTGVEFRNKWYSKCTEDGSIDGLATNITAFVTDHGFNGVHLDWQFPKTGDEYQQLINLSQKLRLKLGTDPVISTVQGMLPEDIQRADKLVQEYANFVVLNAYNYEVPYLQQTPKRTGLMSALEPASEGDKLNIVWGIDELKKSFFPNQMVLGVAAKGQCWFNVVGTGGGRFQEFQFGGPCTGTHYPGLVHYRTVMSDYEGFRHFDDASKTPYAYKENMFVTYDNDFSINMKCARGKDKGLGGFALFEVAGDLQVADYTLQLPYNLGAVRSYQLLDSCQDGFDAVVYTTTTTAPTGTTTAGPTNTTTAELLRTTTTTATVTTATTVITMTATEVPTTRTTAGTTTTVVNTTTTPFDFNMGGIMDRLMDAYFRRFDYKNYFESYMNWFMDKLEEVTWDNTTTEDTTTFEETDTTRTGETTSSTEDVVVP